MKQTCTLTDSPLAAMHPSRGLCPNHSEHISLLETGTSPSASYFAECNLSGHSAEIMFAECRTRQSLALGKEYFAERQAFSKLQHSVKLVFAECKRHHLANIANTVTASPSCLILPSATS